MSAGFTITCSADSSIMLLYVVANRLYGTQRAAADKTAYPVLSGLLCPAAEDDVPQTATGSSQPSPTSATTDGEGSDSSTGVAAANAGQEPADAGVAVGRTYSYVTEAVCDKHVGVFLKAVETVAKLPGQGFAAIKVSMLQFRLTRLRLYCLSFLTLSMPQSSWMAIQKQDSVWCRWCISLNRLVFMCHR